MNDGFERLNHYALVLVAVVQCATAAPAIATPEISVQHGVVSYCSSSGCSRYTAVPNPDGTLSFVALAEASSRMHAPDTVGEIERKLRELLEQLLKLPRTCIWCDLTLKQLWDGAIREWLEGLGLQNIPDGTSLLCPNKDAIKKLLEQLGGKIAKGGSLQPFLDLVKRIQNTEGLSSEVQALLRQLEQLLQQQGAVDPETLQRLTRAIQDLIWKLIFGAAEFYPSAPTPATSQPLKGASASLSGLALPTADCLRLSGEATEQRDRAITPRSWE